MTKYSEEWSKEEWIVGKFYPAFETEMVVGIRKNLIAGKNDASLNSTEEADKFHEFLRTLISSFFRDELREALI